MNILPRIRKLLFLLVFSISYPALFGQDIHFSQFLNSPLTLNPALTGNFEGDWRVVGNFRDQWRSLNFPYRTLSASYDRQIYLGKHHLSAGLLVINDNSSNSFIKSNSFYVSGAYYRTYNKHNFNVGLQLGFVQRRLDLTGITYPESYSNVLGYFDPTVTIADLSVNEKMGYLDANLGFTWSRKIRIFEPQVGFVLYHINRPNASFIGGSNILGLRNTLHASLKTNLSPNFFIKPAAFISSQKGANDFMLGSEVGIGLQGNRYNIREVTGGVFIRNLVVEKTDAMVFMFGVQYSSLSFQLSYDINVSSLNQYTNNRGAFEISIIFKSISTIIKTFTIPCERI